MCFYMTCHAFVDADCGGQSHGDVERQAAKRGMTQRCCLLCLVEFAGTRAMLMLVCLVHGATKSFEL